MAYNKAKAERTWIKWKEAEENTLREQDASEDTIQRLHAYDWQSFCAERRFYEWQDINLQTSHPDIAVEEQREIESVEDLMTSIENENIHDALQAADALTVEILLLKIQGFTSKEIAQKLQLDTYAINQRIYRLRNKLKKYF